MTEIEFKNKKYYLFYNGAAMYALQDIDNVFEALGKDFDVFCRVLSVLSQQGELMRRHEGYDSGEVLNSDELKITMLPYEVVELRSAAINAVISGLKREVEDEKKERDLSLEKFKKKADKTN